MTKAYCKELADYTVWSTEIFCSWLEQISDEQWTQHITSSFNSIQETVLHIIAAETAWLQRLQQNERVVWLQKEFTGTKQEHVELWKHASRQLKAYVDAFDEKQLGDIITFKRFNGEENSMQYYEVFAHAFNHSTFHRGQVVTMLRQAGFTALQSTDLLNYYRIKQIKN